MTSTESGLASGRHGDPEREARDSHPYVLTSNDAALGASLRRWLDESRLDWPATFQLDVQVVETVAVVDDTREAFPQADLLIQAGAPDGTVRITWGSRAMAIVDATEPRATVQMTPEAVAALETAERAFLLVTLLFVLRRVGWYHIHCAALVDPRGRGWLLVGQSCSGKSTTSALLASHGWSVSTDDIGFLSHSRGEGSKGSVEGFRSPIALRDGGQALLGKAGGIDLSRRGKTGFDVEDLGARWVSRVTPEFLLFTSTGTTTSVTALGPRAVINHLIESSLWVLFELVHAQEHLDALARIATQSRAFSATLGPDLFANPDLLQELVQ